MLLISNFKNSVIKSPVLRSVGVYTSIMFLNKGISFLLLFIYTNPRFISPAENGFLNLFASSILFLMPFLSMGILQSTSTDFYKLNKEEFKTFFTSNLIPPVIVFMLSLLGFFFMRDYLKTNFGFPYFFIFLIPLITFLNYLSEQLTLLMRVNHELKKFARVEIVKIILEFGLSVVLVVFFAMRWKGRLAGITISYTMIATYALYYFYKKGYLSGRINKKYIKNELIYAIPLIIMQVSIFAQGTSDKFFLAHFTTNEVLGIYGVACIFANIISLFSSAYLNYLGPTIYQALSNAIPDYRIIKKSFITYARVMIITTALVILIIPFVYKFFINEKYYGAVSYFYLIALGYFIWTLTSFFHSFLLYYKQKRKLVQLSVLSLLISIPTIYFFTRQMGVTGTATGIFISYSLTFILTLLFVKQHIQKLKIA